MEDEEMHAYEDTFNNNIPDIYIDYLSNFEKRCDNRRFYNIDNKWKFGRRLLTLLIIVCACVLVVYFSTSSQVF